MATVREIAQILGVSPSTVSRALRGTAGVSKETAARVRAVAASLSNGSDSTEGIEDRRVRNQTCQTGQSSLINGLPPIACIFANPVGSLSGDVFFSEVIASVISSAKAHGRSVIVETTEATARSRIPDVVDNEQVVGCVVGGIPVARQYIGALLQTNLPCVFIGKYSVEEQSQELSAVIPDNYAGGKLVGEHLAECGYDDFMFIGGDLSIQTFRDRYEGFVCGLEEAGRSLKPDSVITDRIDQEGGYNAMLSIVKRLGSDSVGVFASTDWMAAGALRCLNERRAQVPEQVGVVGYSDLELAAHTYPRLTTVRVPRDALGLLATRTLLDFVDGRITGSIQVYLQPQLVIRESTRSDCSRTAPLEG